MSVDLALTELRRLGTARSARWHDGGIDAFTLAEWAVGAAGEMGEACNIVRKLVRLRADGVGVAATEAELLTMLGDELADVLIYPDMYVLGTD